MLNSLLLFPIWKCIPLYRLLLRHFETLPTRFVRLLVSFVVATYTVVGVWIHTDGLWFRDWAPYARYSIGNPKHLQIYNVGQANEALGKFDVVLEKRCALLSFIVAFGTVFFLLKKATRFGSKISLNFDPFRIHGNSGYKPIIILILFWH